LKRYISISLLVLFLCHSVGHFLLLGGAIVHWKHAVKHNFLQQIDEKLLVEIPKNAVTKHFDGGREIELNGSRYDVVRSNSTSYFCWQDAKETQLWNNLLSHFMQKSSDDSNHDFSILKDIFKTYFVDYQGFIFIKMIFVKIKWMPSCALSSKCFCAFFIPPK
jgi:hypothetical protein